MKTFKRRRVTRACDYCHRRSVRCQQLPGGKCRNCLDFGQDCLYERQVKKRGAPARGKDGEDMLAGVSSNNGHCPLSNGPLRNGDAYGYDQIPHGRIVSLVGLYFEIPSFLRRVQNGEYHRDRLFHAVTMAVCALVSGRVTCGAVTNPQWASRQQDLTATPPYRFYQKAQEEVNLNPQDTSLNSLRTHAVLAIAAIQFGNTSDMHYHMGMYHTLAAMGRWHNEDEWPAAIGNIGREERRRLFWSVYTLDIYTYIVWGGVIRVREQQCRVQYPTEVDDDYIDDKSVYISPRPVSKQNWLRGWNFTTDLYRILEHAVARFKSDDGRRPPFRARDIFLENDQERNAAMVKNVESTISRQLEDLPHYFRDIQCDITYNPREDLYGFQAANIIATTELLRMVLFSVNEETSTLDQRCAIANKIIDKFKIIPKGFQLAISAPLLHHLAGIGDVLGRSSLQLSRNTDFQEGIAQYANNLESVLKGRRVTERLEEQAAGIEEHIRVMQRRQEQQQATSAAATISTFKRPPVYDDAQAQLQQEALYHHQQQQQQQQHDHHQQQPPPQMMPQMSYSPMPLDEAAYMGVQWENYTSWDPQLFTQIMPGWGQMQYPGSMQY
ncbi:uncharacterized protein F5Z01DRAFT_681385 [Emericellopsis atlantica]|uniref:Zn(2)-C6 fungal-type domain-containing protein n=1 Tax=Emericellopsis atlantica TaxID=2614577 RepID=A0A9P7ZLH2_9HYPO|nr:uncharacterized protein F5Z01DRAFT_681385 [Emericellopsis atlantica]KAG9254299.1 hypothetical protein F5Z01DRAFT_681385 [Emericellopsis atlantica]